MGSRRRLPARATGMALALALSLAMLVGAASAADRPSRCGGGQTRASGPGDVCIAPGSDLGQDLATAARAVQTDQPIAGVTYGVWLDGKPVVTGALGQALDGVPATRGDHFRIGNVGETMMTTVLLRLVDDGKLSLDDPVSKWFPELPAADQVTLDMLASSTSGYADFVTTQEFDDAFQANPFRAWTPDELLAIAMQQPMLFAPGTGWGFSDTNFVLLGEVLAQATGEPYGDLVTSQVIDQIGLRSTDYTTSAAIPDPVLHAYSNERGKYEEATYWSPSWVTNAASLTSNLADMGVWAQALGRGTLLSKQSHELQTGTHAGLGPLTAQRGYGMGVGTLNGWTVANPQIDGYTGIVSYLPDEQAAIVVAATFAPGGDISVHYAGMVFNQLAEIVAPSHAPNITTCPRGC